MLVEKFMSTIRTRERSKNTIDLLEMTVVRAEKWLGKPLETAKIEDIIRHIDHIKQNGLISLDKDGKIITDKKACKLSTSSIWTVENKLIQFFTYCFDETDDVAYLKMVKKLKNIKVDKPKNDIRPQDIFSPEDVKKLINVAILERDRCIVAVLFESGLRLGELLSLTNEMVVIDDDKKEVIFHVPNIEGCKTGSRSVSCLQIHGYVEDWMKCNSSKMFMELSDCGVRKITKRLFMKAGIKKPSNPHMFRHSSITNAVNRGMQTNQISMRYWGIANSSMISVYVHLSQQMHSDEYRKSLGMGNGSETTVINPLAVRCVNCGKLIASGDLCTICSENKDLKVKMDEQQSKMMSMETDMKAKMDKIEKTLSAYQDMAKVISSGKIKVIATEHGQPALEIVQNDIENEVQSADEQEQKRILGQLQKIQDKKPMPTKEPPYPYPV